MEKPNHVFKFDEGVLVSKKKEGTNIFKIIITTILVIIVLGSLLFQENLFFELSGTSQVILVLFVIGIFFVGGGSDRVPSPIEIRFYDEYLVVYRKKRPYGKKVRRKEYNKFYYTDIELAEYRTVSKRIQFNGKVDAKWFDYNRDGTLPEKPTYHKIVNGGMCYFYPTDNLEEVVSIIEEHSPIKVIRKES